jgi:hypothetical protein
MLVLMSERVKKRSGATLAVFPSPIFTETAYVSVFRVSSMPLLAIIDGGSLYRRF